MVADAVPVPWPLEPRVDVVKAERITLTLKGMDESPYPEAGYAERIDNLTVDANGTWKNCTAWVSMFTGPVSSTPPTGTAGYQSIYVWNQRPNRQWTIWERATSATQCRLEVFDGPSKTYQTLATRRRVETPNAGTTYIPLAGWLYMINGYDQPLRWNGRWPNHGSVLRQIGFPSRPPPPSLVVGAPDNELSEGQTPSGLGHTSESFRYGYAVTWLNELGCESPPSEIRYLTATNSAIVDGRLHAKLTFSVPPAHVVAVRMYRTTNLVDAPATAEGARFSLYLLQEFPSATEQVWEDGVQDDYLGHELDVSQTGLLPSGVRYGAVFKGTLFVAGSASYPDRVFYSAPTFVEQFPAANTFDFGTGGAGGEITGLHATKNALIVFRRSGVYAVKGDPINGFYAETITEDVGCLAGGAVVDMPATGGRRGGVMFLAADGPYILEGALENEGVPTQVVPAMARIRRTWQMEVDVSALAGARAVRFEREQEILFYLPSRGLEALDYGTLGLAFHYIHGWWSRRGGEPRERITACCNVPDARGLVLLCGTTGSPMVPSGRFLVRDGEMVWRYRLAWWGSKIERATVSRVEIVGGLNEYRTAAGDPGIFLRYRTDRKLMEHVKYDDAYTLTGIPGGVDEARPINQNQSPIETEYAVDLWETARFDTGYWQRPSPRVYPISLANASGYEVQFELLGGDLQCGPVELAAMVLDVTRTGGEGRRDQAGGSARP